MERKEKREGTERRTRRSRATTTTLRRPTPRRRQHGMAIAASGSAGPGPGPFGKQHPGAWIPAACSALPDRRAWRGAGRGAFEGLSARAYTIIHTWVGLGRLLEGAWTAAGRSSAGGLAALCPLRSEPRLGVCPTSDVGVSRNSRERLSHRARARWPQLVVAWSTGGVRAFFCLYLCISLRACTLGVLGIILTCRATLGWEGSARGGAVLRGGQSRIAQQLPD